MHIPPCAEATDVEMEDVNAPLGFEPKFSHSGYDFNLVQHSDNTTPGSISPVMAQENQMLDKGLTQTKAPETGRLGTEENPGSSYYQQEEVTPRDSFFPWHGRS